MGLIGSRNQQTGALLGLYSIPGAGKTMAAGAFMKLLYERTNKPCLYADYEFGDISIPSAVPFDLWRPGLGDPISEGQELVEIMKAGEHSALIVDTISSFGDLVMRHITDKTTSNPPSSITTSTGKVLRAPALSDYNLGQLAFQQWAANLQPLLSLNCHVLWLAHEQLVQITDANGSIKEVIGGPDIIGSKLTRTAPKLPHIFARLVVVNGKRYFRAEADGYWIAKDRLRVIPPRGVEVSATGTTPEELERNILQRYEVIWGVILDRLNVRKGESA